LKRYSGLPISKDHPTSDRSIGLRSSCYPAAALSGGLFIAQALSTLQVYLSNRALYQTLAAVQGAGYIPVPNQRIMGHLHDLGPALCGGLFFTLSLGAGISLLSFAAAWVWDRIFARSATFLISLLPVWAALIAGVNWRGISPLASAYFLLIPPVVFMITLGLMPPRRGRPSSFFAIIPLIPVLVLASLWGMQMDGHLFSKIRDRLLLSSSTGRGLTKLYYRYTLYPAEVIKPLELKTIKTCSLEQIGDRSLKSALERKLLEYDYLNTGEQGGADLTITQSGETLILKNRGRTVVKTDPAHFISDPAGILRDFSSGVDRYGFFRGFIFFSLLVGLPITLYLFLYTLLFLILSGFFPSRVSTAFSSILCLSAGILALLPLLCHGPETPHRQTLSRSVESGMERASVEDLLKKLQETEIWYDQWRAYRALRALGWKQEDSRQRP